MDRREVVELMRRELGENFGVVPAHRIVGTKSGVQFKIGRDELSFPNGAKDSDALVIAHELGDVPTTVLGMALDLMLQTVGEPPDPGIYEPVVIYGDEAAIDDTEFTLYGRSLEANNTGSTQTVPICWWAGV